MPDLAFNTDVPLGIRRLAFEFSILGHIARRRGYAATVIGLGWVG